MTLFLRQSKTGTIIFFKKAFMAVHSVDLDIASHVGLHQG